ncbi:MAG: hypothetical protein DHS20C11_07020 [Lysobacteraceae bacterium]|nr:MAG: hypothetical protein DHS20C11_07020 [Xanthomonadaceae bacterium]
MIELTRQRQLTHLRRLALSAQGLVQARPFGRGLAGAKKAIGHIGYVQIDTISVVERAHNHVLYSRVPGFKPEMINRLLLSGDIFEYWSHAEAFLPIEDFRYSLPYKAAIKNGQVHWYRTRDRKLMAELLARIREDGPLRSRDVESGSKNRAGWWDWKPAKKALEQLYMQGDLMVCSREGFQKTYDLTERVLPDQVDTSMPNTDELAAHLLDQQLRCHGFASQKGLTYLRRDKALREAMKALVSDGLAQHQLQQFRIKGGETFIARAGTLEQPLSRMRKRVSILSPFDNCVIQRDRLKRVFDFNYQIECYVPAAKRQYGYFCLPLLYGDKFVGRMDCKAHRKDGVLEIKSLHLEEEQLDQDRFVTALAEAIVGFCKFQGCDSVSVTNTYPAHIKQRLIRTPDLRR